MTKAQHLTVVAERLSDDQLDALIQFAEHMSEPPFLDTAPPDALASLERGLAQLANNESVSLAELTDRLQAAAASHTK